MSKGKHIVKIFGYIVMAVISISTAHAAPYKIDRNSDGPFSFKIYGQTLNEGSGLTRESILFNDPTCPVSVTAHTTKITYKDRGFRINGKSTVQVSSPIVAMQLRTILYDVFGQHMKNLANTEPKDFSAGQSVLEGEWRASDHDVSEMLTTVTYVARVRFADGRQWMFNSNNLQAALRSLNLEQKIGEDSDD